MIHQTVAQAVFTRYGRAMVTAASIQLLPLHNLRMLTSALRLRMGLLARLSLEHFCDVYATSCIRMQTGPSLKACRAVIVLLPGIRCAWA
jgi:hypothetical protein